MDQALHIFAKDVRCLYREASLLVGLAVIFAVWQTVDVHGQEMAWVLELVIATVAAFTIVRVIHAESIVGDSQFWVTRPYIWKSLLAAKVLFILAFVNVPVFFAQVVILGVDGFPVFSNWAGLLWSQLLMIFALELPVAAVAALTRGMVASTAGALVLGLMAAGVQMQINPMRFPEPFDWLRSAIAFLAAALIAPPLLYLQFKNRRTLFNRLWALGAATLGIAAFLLTPWPALFAVQSLLSKQSFDLRLAPDTDVKMDLFSRVSKEGKELHVVLPVKMSSLPPGYRPEFEDFVITLRAPDGRTMRLSEGQLLKDYQEDNKLGIRGHAPLDSAFFDSAASELLTSKPLSLHATFYITVVGNSHRRSFSIPDAPRDVSDRLQCYADRVGDLICLAAFRLPASLTESGNRNSDSTAWDEKNLFKHSVSYSPFPATLSINPIKASEPYYIPPERSVATIVTDEPLAFLRRDFEIPNVRIAIR